jgi:hypothetical protein
MARPLRSVVVHAPAGRPHADAGRRIQPRVERPQGAVIRGHGAGGEAERCYRDPLVRRNAFVALESRRNHLDNQPAFSYYMAAYGG